MDGSKFDRLTCALAKLSNRRALLALLGVAAIGVGQRAATGTQLGPATCGSQGDVCTLLLGCCSGFTCVTSGTNTSYGICVTGSGGMMAASSSLISPHSETLDQEVAALAANVAAIEADTTATDLQAERDARIAEIKARKDTKRSKRKTRLDTKRSTLRTRRDDKKERRRAADPTPTRTATTRSSTNTSTRTPTPTPQVPKLQLELFLTLADVEGEEDGTVIETVKVTNQDTVNVVLTRIEPKLDPSDGTPLTTPEFTLGPGKSYLFVSGLPVVDATADRFRWWEPLICSSDVSGDGFLVKAAHSSNSANHDFVILCDAAVSLSTVEAAQIATTPVPRKRKHDNDERKNKKKR